MIATLAGLSASLCRVLMAIIPAAKTLEVEKAAFPARMHLVQLHVSFLSAVSSLLAFGLCVLDPLRMGHDQDRTGTRATPILLKPTANF